MRRVLRLVGTLLVAVGVALLAGVGGLYGYATYERVRFEQEVALTPLPDLSELPVPTDTPTPQPTSTPSPLPSATARLATAAPSATRTATPSRTPRPTSTPTPVPLPARRLVAPKINLDTRVVEAPLRNGTWDVPKFVAGHLEGTAQPGEGSNVVLVGHVESISSGNVFASIDGLEPGDGITLMTDRDKLSYVVREKLVVRNDDVSVLQPTSEETLTLITCTGTFIPAIRDYDHRLIVIAKTTRAAPAVRPARAE